MVLRQTPFTPWSLLMYLINVLAVPVGHAPESEWNVNRRPYPACRFLLPEFLRPRHSCIHGASHLILKVGRPRERVNAPDCPRCELNNSRSEHDEGNCVAYKRSAARQESRNRRRDPRSRWLPVYRQGTRRTPVVKGWLSFALK